MTYFQCCPACQSTDQELMFDMGLQPMSLVQLQRDPDKSDALERYPIRLMICRSCGHVHNIYFDPRYVSYSAEGCRMYNNGAGWQVHVENVLANCARIEDLDLVVEIGAGDCDFLSRIKTDAVKLAVDPCEAVEQAEELGIQYVRDYFDADKHMPECNGVTLVIMRHLLEHMLHPRTLIEQIVKRAKERKHPTIILVEVPCCQQALQRTRIEDWTYEHPQHFTVNSLSRLFRAVGIMMSQVETSYGGEVCVGWAKIDPQQTRGLTVDTILENYNRAEENISATREWFQENKVAFWGGAGKSAMFIRKFNLPEDTTVVDSHEIKHNFYVPGTRIKIMNPITLRKFPVDYIVATTSWRANDIRDEIVRDSIPCKALLKFENGELVEVPLGQN